MASDREAAAEVPPLPLPLRLTPHVPLPSALPLFCFSLLLPQPSLREAKGENTFHSDPMMHAGAQTAVVSSS